VRWSLLTRWLGLRREHVRRLARGRIGLIGKPIGGLAQATPARALLAVALAFRRGTVAS
jgi:hypothetical protein